MLRTVDLNTIRQISILKLSAIKQLFNDSSNKNISKHQQFYYNGLTWPMFPLQKANAENVSISWFHYIYGPQTVPS